MKVYVVMVNSDLIEGRGSMMMDTIWDNPDSAIKRAGDLEPYSNKIHVSSLGDYYARGQFTDVVIHNVYSEYEELKQIEDEKIKAAALTKLTTKERKLLGL